jgi:hypothetical protein
VKELNNEAAAKLLPVAKIKLSAAAKLLQQVNLLKQVYLLQVYLPLLLKINLKVNFP